MTKMAKWYKIAQIEDVPSMGSRKVVIGEIEIAIFNTNHAVLSKTNPTIIATTVFTISLPPSFTLKISQFLSLRISHKRRYRFIFPVPRPLFIFRGILGIAVFIAHPVLPPMRRKPPPIFIFRLLSFLRADVTASSL